jgi:hypothetical protein
MADANVITKQLVAAAAGAVCAAQGLAAAGNLVLNGTLVANGVATFDSQRRVSITSAGNDSGISFTVYGAGQNGQAISETVVGGNAVEVDTLQDFLTVTRVASSGAVATTVQVGSAATGSTPWIIPNPHITPTEIAAGLELISGAATASVEVTDDSPLAQMPIYTAGYAMTPPIPRAEAWPGLNGQNNDAQAVINRTVAAIRLTITAGQGMFGLTLRQAGITQN